MTIKWSARLHCQRYTIMLTVAYRFQMSVRFAPRRGVAELQAILRQVQQKDQTQKWPWTLQIQRYTVCVILTCISPSPKLNSIFLLYAIQPFDINGWQKSEIHRHITKILNTSPVKSTLYTLNIWTYSLRPEQLFWRHKVVENQTVKSTLQTLFIPSPSREVQQFWSLSLYEPPFSRYKVFKN